jgi:Txe/YoeB family toxin of Txe-Axe toxin-antitoxin module
MIITSMGIFGFLSKAHSDQNLVSGEVLSKISLYDEKIKTAKENIDANRKALKQMDEAVDQVMARSSSETGADKAVALRRAQLKERARLQSEIQAEQKAIVALNEERAPIAAQVRQVEAKVGPVKYIAALIYGDNPDANILEKAVTWVIIVIVSVFDPLAIIMLLAAQMTFQWIREQKKAEDDSPEKESDIVSTATVTEQPDLAEEANALIAEIEKEPAEFIPPEEPKKPDFDSSKHPYLYTGFSSFKDLKPMVHKPEDPVKEPNISVDAVVEFVPAPVQATDAERPSDYLILPELSEESKKKVYDKAEGSTDSQDQAVTYIQNSEQNEETLWQRLQRKKDELKPIDRLYKEYSRDEFKGLETENLEPELFDFIEQTKERGPRFNNFDSEKLEYFARRIYELRKD